jgi:16S rRNA (guanine966-N2)-methyltransferase
VPSGRLVRPTSNRAREALFSILAERVVGARVLDAFAGTGALGLEALSRGAQEVCFVESNPGVAMTLQKTLSHLGVEPRCRVLVGDAVRALGRGALDGPFDLVFADPPYRAELADRFLRLVAQPRWIGPAAIVIIERDRLEPPAPAPSPILAHLRSARYGMARFDLYEAP